MIAALASARIRIVKSPLAMRFLRGSFWSAAGTVVSSGITLITMVFLARLLEKVAYGEFIAIQSTVSMIGVFAGFGVGAVGTRYTAELRNREPARLGRILALAERIVLAFGIVATIGLILGSHWLTSRLLNAPTLALPLCIAAISVPLTTLDAYQKSVLIGLERLRTFAVGTIGAVLIALPIMLLAANQYGLVGAAAAVAISAACQFLISRHQMIRELKTFGAEPNSSGCLEERPILWQFAFPALLAGAMVSPAHWAVQAMLVNTDEGYAKLALLGVAMQWFNVVMFLPATIGRVVLPILTDHVATNDYTSTRRILLYAMGANALIAVPIALVIAVFSPFIISLYGTSFEGGSLPLALAVATAALLAVQTPVGNLITARSRMWLGALMNAGWAGSFIFFAYQFIDSGATGAMLALAGAYVLHTLWVGCYAIHQIRRSLQ